MATIMITGGSGFLGTYGASKAAAEIVGLTYYSTNGIDFVALRNSAIYGHGMRYPMYIKPMVENSARGLPTRFAKGGDMRRDYSHVKDITQALKTPPAKARGVLSVRSTLPTCLS